MIIPAASLTRRDGAAAAAAAAAERPDGRGYRRDDGVAQRSRCRRRRRAHVDDEHETSVQLTSPTNS